MSDRKPGAGTFFDTPVGFLKGVGPQRAEIFDKEFGILTFGDLIRHYPYRHIDRTRIYKISEINDTLPYIQLKGKIISIGTVGAKKSKRLVAQFRDESGSIELVWFRGIKWMTETLRAGIEYIVFGKPSSFQNEFNIIHPEMEIASEAVEVNNKALQPLYNTTEKSKARGIDSRAILRLQRILSEKFLQQKINDTLPLRLIESLKLSSLQKALTDIHFPPDTNELRKAQFRLKFEEFFFLQLRLLEQKLIRTEKNKGYIFLKVGEHFNYFFHHLLPFSLTDAQKRVLKEIRKDTGSGKQMNRLLQGDVGSGKTLVALMSMLLAIDNGYQSCIMAPTEILAKQHFETIKNFLGDMKIEIALLTGSTKNAERKSILAGLQSGDLKILIGTHALIENEIQFNNLGFAVIDEQHRFGVEQRARLALKGSPSLPDSYRDISKGKVVIHTDFSTVTKETAISEVKTQNPLSFGEGKGEASYPHILVMTATPIPRTLAMTLYGDLDVSVIDEMPAGRKPIKTSHYYESQRLKLNGFLKEQIRSGRQVFIVFPLIEESEKIDLRNLMQGYEAICRDFPLPQYRVSVVHGKMKTADRDAEMKKFVEGKTHIMVATTVIEVGVNIPNASVMVIESAERFGLSQLHQLRGRVGRGADQSYCILMTGNALGSDSRMRMQTMVRTNDGFEIAETDLKLRGPGDIQGTQQSGIVNLKIADISKDTAILELARKAAIHILDKDPHLISVENTCLREVIQSVKKDKFNWGKVS